MFQRFFRAVVLVITLFLFAGIAVAQSDMPTVNISITADGMTVPESVSGGLAHLVFENTGEAPFIPIFAQLGEGVSMDAVLEALFTEDMSIMSQLSFKGGPGVLPGQTVDMMIDLAPGEYMLANVGAEMPQVTSFVVEESGDTMMEEPVADVTLTMVDFGYGIPMTIGSGENLWRIENIGEQWHEMTITPVEAGTTIEDVRAILMEEMETGEPMLPQFPVIMPLDGDQVAWVSVDLEPGTYVLLCNLPDIMATSEEHLHHELGMIQLITVTDTLTYEDDLLTVDYPAELDAYPNIFSEFDSTFPFPNYAFSSSAEVNELSLNYEPLPADGWGFGVLFFPSAMFADMGLSDDASLADMATAWNTMMIGDDPELASVLDAMVVESVTLDSGMEVAQVDMPAETEDNLVVFFEPTDGVIGLVSLLTAPGARTDEQIEHQRALVNSIEFKGSLEDMMAGMNG